MSNRREQILRGELLVPEQIVELVNPLEENEITLLINEFFQHLWHNFLLEKHVDTMLWFNLFNNKKVFNNLLKHLSKAGWITSTVHNNFAYILLEESKLMKWITVEELRDIRHKYKFEKYRLKQTESTVSDLVQLNGKRQKTGLVREGFARAGNCTFQYDTRYLNIYLDYIAENIKKGLTNSTKDITYQEICDELLNYYSNKANTYTLGKCLIDSRGRAIYDCTHKIFNPIASKDARALLIHPYPAPLDGRGWDAVYAAIAELNGYRGRNYEDKVGTGTSMYLTREMPDITEMELNVGNNKWEYYEDLHKRIWLERIYENIDNYAAWDEKWYVPIEIDATASAIQFIGVLTNDYEYMKRTNLIETEEGFQDIWTLPYTSRNHVKKAMTPQLYGSGQHTSDLWDKHKLEYDQVQLNKMGEEISVGMFANACKFKDFIINNVQPQERMKITIDEETFYIECNRFKWDIVTQIDYYIYTSQQGLLKKVSKSFNLAYDLKQFKRYFVTLLIHNLDSQVANKIAKNTYWILPNHDSFIVHPNDVMMVKCQYKTRMKYIHTLRKQILREYFYSIGITKEYVEKEYEETNDPVDKPFSPHCLK